MLLERGMKVAVLAVDPSSKRSKGSILGDKTRMEKMSASEHAFVRPSPSSETLGGVARKTRESILLCEAAGYDVVLVETVGVGQSETTVHSMTDFFLLLMLAGAGDELQGIKRGIMEMADFIAINKAEGENIPMSRAAMTDYRNALHLMPPKSNGWIAKVDMISAMEGTGLEAVLEHVEQYFTSMKASGDLEENRTNQALTWFSSSLDERIRSEFYAKSDMSCKLSDLKRRVLRGDIDPFAATDELFNS
jgi:LAO/AO transport system kinase